MTHLGSWNINYSQNKGWESNWQFNSWALKIGNHLDFLVCRWHATYIWNFFDKGYNFALDLTSIEGLHTKLWASKITRVPSLGISRFPLGNDIWVLVPWPGIEYTIKGKVVASPKFGLWWVLWIHVYLWFIHSPKCSNYILTDLLFGLCRFVWVIDLFINLLSPHPGTLARPSIPKCCKLNNTPQLFILLLFSPLDS
jgi:hypothetical protein